MMNGRAAWAALLVAGILVATAEGEARAGGAVFREGVRAFKTYPFSDPDPVPRLGLKGANIYPYFRFDGYTDTPVQKEWKTVELENDYLKVLILPEIGGKVWTAVEKSTGRDFLYHNHVVKFRDIALRGPWTSGGIEANYGIIGHTPNCATPVDYLVRRSADGGVSCVTGGLDLLTRTPWRLEIHLPPDKAYFTTCSYWANPMPLEQPYYTWMNVGIPAGNDLQFCYAGTDYLGHEGEHASWPGHANGKDLSWYRNNDFGPYKSYHVFGVHTDFFGAYWHDRDFGMGRYAPRDEKPGKKIWIWGLSQQGMIWEKLLTDADGQYVEVQSGRLFNQSAEASTRTPFKHRGFAPHDAQTWTEYWFPVKGTKGMVKATPVGTINLTFDGQRVFVAFCPLEAVKDTLVVRDGTGTLYEKAIDLQPMQPFSDSFTVKEKGRREQLQVLVGKQRIEYTQYGMRHGIEANEQLSRPTDSPPFDWDSMYGLYLQGKEHIRQRNYERARDCLQRSLDKDANFVPTLNELAALALRRMDGQAAGELVKRALAIDTYDGQANFLHGLASREAGRPADAKDGFEIASASPEYRSPAFTELARLYLHERQPGRAIECAGKALDYNRYNLDARQIRALACRLTGRKEQAAADREALLQLDPLNPLARFEKVVAGEMTEAQFAQPFRGEMPDQTFLELGIWYWKAGSGEAARVLAGGPQTPEVLYWRARLAMTGWSVGPRTWRELLADADAASPVMVFPFRPETAEILERLRLESKTWKPAYYLALIHWHLGDLEDARTWCKQCGDPPDFAPFYVLRARLFPDQAEKDLQHAAKMDPAWRYGYLLAEHELAAGWGERAVKTIAAVHERFSANYVAGLLHAKALLRAGRHEACEQVLARLHVLPYEGATEGRQLYKETLLMLAAGAMRKGEWAKALERIAASRVWPENLGVGKPYPDDVDERLEDFLEAWCREQLDQRHEADKVRQRLLAARPSKDAENLANRLVVALTLRKRNQNDEARKLLQAWAGQAPVDPLVRWCKEVYEYPAGAAAATPKDLAAANENVRILAAVLAAW